MASSSRADDEAGRLRAENEELRFKIISLEVSLTFFGSTYSHITCYRVQKQLAVAQRRAATAEKLIEDNKLEVGGHSLLSR